MLRWYVLAVNQLTLCTKANKKISAFSKVSPFISREQALVIYSVVILSLFNYCPLLFLFCNKDANKGIDRIYKHAHGILYGEYECSCEILKYYLLEMVIFAHMSETCRNY